MQKGHKECKFISDKKSMVDQCCYQNVLYVVIKNQDWWKKKKQKVLLSSLGFKTPVSKIPVLGEILFLMQFHG